jgi:Terminase RNaseH-like domain
LDSAFKKQNDFVLDPSRFIVAQCSRRAGKSSGLGLRFKFTMDRHPRSTCLYISLTYDSAKNIMWPVLNQMNDDFNLDWTFNESRLEIKAPNGSKLRLLGADQKNFIKRIKGVKSPGVAIDEAQDFGTHLQSLVNDVIGPTLADYEDSWLAVTGTPGPMLRGYWYDIAHDRKFGYSWHGWTILENPYMPNPEKFVAEFAERNEWQPNNPSLLREWRNQWVSDPDSMWIRYSETINHYQQLPQNGHSWEYILGADIGFKDSDALAVVAFQPTSPRVYLVEEVITAKQGLTELVAQIEALRVRYKFSKIVMDEGGLGKKLAEEIRRQHQIPVQPASKARKQETVAFLNDALRLQRFMAKGASRFAHESYEIQIDWEKSTPDKIVTKGKHSDIIDAVIYAFKESPAYQWEKAKVVHTPGTRAWQDKEADEMFERELQRALEEKAEKETQNEWFDLDFD